MAKHKIWIRRSDTESITTDYSLAAINYDKGENSRNSKSVYLRKESKTVDYIGGNVIEGSHKQISLENYNGNIGISGVQSVFTNNSSSSVSNVFNHIIDNHMMEGVKVFTYLGLHQDIYDYSMDPTPVNPRV